MGNRVHQVCGEPQFFPSDSAWLFMKKNRYADYTPQRGADDQHAISAGFI
ncbi:MAG: hypothetical protein IKP00_04930 [Victivallales bacterium]|nr:hypothetical protein [Victivallales bacterium]